MEVAPEKENIKKCKIAASLLCFYLFVPAAFVQQFPQPVGYVNDFARVIPPNYTAQIDALCRELETKTGAELAIVTVDSIGDEDYVEYANRLFEKWGIGKKNQDNGVLLFVTLRERRVRIETGYGIEGIIPDITAGRILDDYVVPEFRRGDYGAGMLAGAKAIAGLIAADKGVEITGAVRPNLRRRRSNEEGFPFGWIILLLIFLFMGGPRWLWPLLLMGQGGSRGRHRDWGGGFGGGFGGFGGGGGFGGFGGGGSGGGGAGRGF
jgi:uncharacterized protein